MKTKLIYIILILATLLGSEQAWSQASMDAYDDIEVTPELDTIVHTRSNGSWWYGAQGGASYYQALGTLYTLYTISEIDRDLENGISFSSANGWGVNYGLIGEWVEPGSFFSATLRIDYDRVININGNSDIQTNLGESAANANFSHDSEFSFVSISPSLRYNLANSGFHLLGGLNIGIPVYEKATIDRFGVNETANINDGRTFNYNSENSNTGVESSVGQYELVKTHYGLHFGLGFDYLLGDVFGVGRLKATPFAIANYNFGVASGALPEPFNKVESNMSLASLRAGMQIKFAYDNITSDTLPFDSTYTPPAVIALDVLDEGGINFEGFIKPKTVEPEEISYVELPKIKEQLREDAIINLERPSDEPSDIAEVPQQPKFEIKENREKTFNYSSYRQTGLTPDMREYLDALADYFRANPNAMLLLVAHTDNSGSASEQESRAQRRLDRAVSYLMDKGVPKRSIIDENRGGRRPIASNRTEEGRRKNRRLLITVKPPRSRR